jgi:hypothetical protein
LPVADVLTEGGRSWVRIDGDPEGYRTAASALRPYGAAA